MLTHNNLQPNKTVARSPSNTRDSTAGKFSCLDQLKIRNEYPRGTVLFVEGQKPRGVYILNEGRAKISIASADGKSLVLRIAHQGELLGINAALMGRPYDSTAKTLDHCQIDFISRGNLLSSLEHNKEICTEVVHALSRKLNDVVEHNRLLFLSHSAVEKLARLLLRWCDEYGAVASDGIAINFQVTQEEIAQMICSSRETVARVLGDFKRKEIIAMVGHQLLIRHRTTLEGMVTK